MDFSRANMFAITVIVSFLLPLAIPGVGLDTIYFFILVIVLFAWFLIKWDSVKALTSKSNTYEMLCGGGIIAAVYAYKAIIVARVGLIDLLVIFGGGIILVYGIRSLKSFWVPIAYGVVLLAGYQIEGIIPNYVALQDWLAGVMASAVSAVGISATASGEIVAMNLANGTPVLLDVSGACTGLQGILAFGLLSTMTLLDLKPKMSRLIPLFAIGFLGAFLINIVRLFVVFLTFEYFGIGAGSAMHAYFGYVIFIVWVLAFWALAFRYLSPALPGTATPSLSPTKPITSSDSSAAC